MFAKILISSALVASFSSAFAVDERLAASADGGNTATGLPHTNSAHMARPIAQLTAQARRALQTPEFGTRLSADGSSVNVDSGDLHQHRHAIDKSTSGPTVTRGNVD